MTRLLALILALSALICGEARAQAGAVYDLRSFGAACNGSTDDTAAISAWLARAAPNVQLTAPPGVCLFSQPLSAPAGGVSNVTIQGSGPYSTIFKYVGPPTTTTGALLSIGDGAHAYVNWLLQGFSITSATRMASGSAVHLQYVGRSALRDVIIDGQDGTGNFYNGIWFDKVDAVFFDHFQARAQNDAVDVNGTGAGWSAGLYLTNCKIASSAVGVHVGGGFGGITAQQCDIIANGVNLEIDNQLVPVQNREVFIGDTTFLDTATSGPGVLINDSLSTALTVALNGWIATGTQAGVDIRSARGAKISIAAPVIWNFRGDGVRIEDGSAFVSIGTHTLIHDNGGFGVNCTAPEPLVTPGAQPLANTSGAYAPNCLIENLNLDNGYKKYPNGMIRQWIAVSFTGPAGAILSPIGGNPVKLPTTFPNAIISSTIKCQTYGFFNGPAQMTVTGTPYATTGLYVNLVSSVPVSNSQIVHCDVWGY